MANLFLNLGNQLQNNPNFKGVTEQLSDISGKLGNMLASFESIKDDFVKRKKLALQRLQREKSKNGSLALLALGYGTLASMLESAFCGEVLDVWS